MWRENKKYRLLVCANNSYLAHIFDTATQETKFTSSLTAHGSSLRSSVCSMGDNMDNGVVLIKGTAYLVTQLGGLSKIVINEKEKSAVLIDLNLKNISDVATDGKHVYYVTLNGLISNLEHSNITLKLPCQDDEKFTHMKYGCGMLIAISYRQVNSESISRFHLVKVKDRNMASANSVETTIRATGNLG